jgi:hypothetical protein
MEMVLRNQAGLDEILPQEPFCKGIDFFNLFPFFFLFFLLFRGNRPSSSPGIGELPLNIINIPRDLKNGGGMGVNPVFDSRFTKFSAGGRPS